MEVKYIREPSEEELSKVPKWSATSERILEVIKTKRSVSTVELSRLTAYKLSTINAQISILRRMGLIENARLGVRNSPVTEIFNPSVNGQLGIESVYKDKESVGEKPLEKRRVEETFVLIPSQNQIRVEENRVAPSTKADFSESWGALSQEQILRLMEEVKTIGMTRKQIASKIGRNTQEVNELLNALKEKGVVTHVGRGLWILRTYEDMSKDPHFVKPEQYIKEFEKKYNLKMEEYKRKITFSGNGSRYIHRWSPYVQGFSANFVDDILTRHGIKEGQWVLDPFVGSGTVSVCAKTRGINSVGVDLMPLMAFMSKVKTTWDLDASKAKQELNRIRLHWRKPAQKIDLPFLKETTRQFDQGVLESLLALRESILSVEDEKTRNLFELAFASILVDSSNLKRSPCLGYVKDRKVERELPFVLFQDKIEKMLRDLSFVQNNLRQDAEAELILGDARIIRYRAKSFDLAVTSPPYVNGMDYIINYKIEMAWLDLVKNYEDLEKLKTQMVSCDNISKSIIRDFSQKNWDFRDEWLEDVLCRIAQRIQQKGNYRRNDMHLIVRKYFEDLFPVFRNVYEGLKEGGHFILVIGDSLIAGTYIPADLILGRMGIEIGFTIEKIEKARERRSGQRRDFVLRESILTLAKGSSQRTSEKLDSYFD